MRVVLTDEARRDLEEIGDYIARDSPVRARTFVREVLASARRIGETPRGFPVVPRYERHGVRRRVHAAYLIFYRLEEDRVSILHILHILHGARDYRCAAVSAGMRRRRGHALQCVSPHAGKGHALKCMSL